jgi:hypothetical protein
MPTQDKIEPRPNELAIIVAFYISKFDRRALETLGYTTYTDAFKNIGESLGVKENYIKFRRDEFDPVHPWRKGWRREMDRRIISAIEALQDLSEQDLAEIVRRILNDTNYRRSDEIQKITSLFDNEEPLVVKDYILRGPTGKRAEEEFISYYSKNRLPINGELIDTRDEGTGYDFKIKTGNEKYYIEVKGLSEASGGILFTSKEWQTANLEKDKYFLVIVSNVDTHPLVKIIKNPASKLAPKRNVLRTIQVNWSVSPKELQTLSYND